MLLRAIILCAFVLLGLPAIAGDGDLQCEAGPITKTFGGTPWLMYGCNEERHLQFVSAPRSAAGQVVFMLFWDKDRWVVMDLGDENNRAADAALRDIQSLSESEIVALIAETKAH